MASKMTSTMSKSVDLEWQLRQLQYGNLVFLLAATHGHVNARVRLSVMVFAYTGLLGVYFTALFTDRGSERSVAMALVASFLTTLLLQAYVWDKRSGSSIQIGQG